MIFWSAKFGLLFCLLSGEIWGKIWALDIRERRRMSYAYWEVCESFGHRDNVLVERLSYTQLDCMGKVVSVEQFCRKRHGHSPLYLRGFLPVKGGVICEKGLEVELEYECQGQPKGCSSVESHCHLLGRTFAANLVFYQGKKVGNVLKCQYRATQGRAKKRPGKS